jgi:hypothetical protein
MFTEFEHFNFKKEEKFNFKEEQPLFCCVITKLNYKETTFDFSIFTNEEWQRLKELNSLFKLHQTGLEESSDSYYEWMFHKDNLKRNENLLYKDNIYWMDNELKKNFKIFLNLDVEENQTQKDIILLYNLSKHFSIIKKDVLRKWFVTNIEKLNECCYSIENLN